MPTKVGGWLEDQKEQLRIVAQAFEVGMLAVFAKRLGMISDTADYLNVYSGMADDLGKVESLIDQLRQAINARLDAIKAELGQMTDAWAKPYYDAQGIPQVLSTDDYDLAMILNGGASKWSADLDDLTKNSVLRIIGADGQASTLHSGYQEMIDRAVRQISGGFKTREAAIEEAVNRLSKFGLRVEYESGLTRELFSAVSMNISDGFFKVFNDLARKQGELFGADGVEIDAHALCAPDHLPYQGRQFSDEKYEEINEHLASTGGRPFEHGMNCHHIITPILMGVDSPEDEDYLDDLAKRSNKQVEWTTADGKKYKKTAYEFTQAQRAMEVNIRKLKVQSELRRRAGLDTSGIDREIKLSTSEYIQVSKRVGLPPDPSRLQVLIKS